MSAWKQFTTKDVTITPFIADKGFSFTGSAMTGSDIGVDFYLGRNVVFSSSADLNTGFTQKYKVSQIYNSSKQLYYTNFLTQSTGDVVQTASLVPGVNPEDDRFEGPIQCPRYENYLQSSLTQSRFFPTDAGNRISTISIPQKLFGEKIVPYTFEFTFSSSVDFPNGITLTDDGEGNVISGSDNKVVGQIFYPHGIVVLTTHSCEEIGKQIDDSTALESATVNFSSSITIYEQQYKCTILENEFGFSQNPTLLTSSDQGLYNNEYYPFVTGSYFTPYVTCVGLYNESKQLVAVGKLSFPVPISQFTDTTIMVNFDV